jgi:hypothetical protein
MKIVSSSIAMSGKSNLTQTRTKEESLKTWVGNQPLDFENKKHLPDHSIMLKLDLLEISEQAKKALQTTKNNLLGSIDCIEDASTKMDDEASLKIKMIEDFIKALTGKKIRLLQPEAIKIKSDNITVQVQGKQLQVQPSDKKGWGVEYDYHEAVYEHSEMSFSTEGKVKTADGREIDFSLQLNMSREFASRKDISIRLGDAKIDPLVINFDSPTVQLTDTKITFDLDSDGEKDQISFVGSGSGFLALDLNSDGKINDGGELFGPKSGNGFADLAKLDSDGNNWIDENDPIFDKLRIWTKDADGNDKLFALGEKGIGAIYLGNVDTSFNIKNQNNESQGEIQKTGVFLKENGSAGTIQHIDLTL